MKTSDLKPGTYYAYARYDSDRDRPERVKVLAADVTEKIKPRISWGQAPMSRGVKIEFKGGGLDIVRPQTIRQTWADFKREQKEAKEARQAHEASQQREREAQAALAFRLHTALVEKGSKVGISYDYRDANYEALLAAGFTPCDEIGRIYHNHVNSALNDISTFMDNGTVNADQVAFLLGWTDEAPRPDDSLDDYDLDD